MIIMPFTDEEIETGLLNGAREAELRSELGDATYEDLRALGAQISAENSSALANELFGLGKPRKSIYILPGIMGSKLSVKSGLGEDLIWFDPVSLAAGQVTKLRFNPAADGVIASGVFWSAYGWLRLKLTLAGYRVRFIPYDWRRPTYELGEIVHRQIAANDETDVTLVAHSMGGLLARHIAQLDAGERRISRIVTLGTPNGGSYSPVQVFRNVHSMVAKLGALDQFHTAEEIVQDVLRAYPGLVEMMPDPGLRPAENYFDYKKWPNTGTRPVAQVLENALEARKRLPAPDDRFHQIIGIGEKTIVSATVKGNELQFRYSLDGDGTVPRDLAELPDLPKTFIEASHGGLVKDRSVLSTLERLMEGQAPRTFAERERYVPRLNLETLQTDVVPEQELRNRIQAAARKPVTVEDLVQEFLGTPSRPDISSQEAVAAAATAPKVRLIGGYPVNLVRQATENWQDAAPLREKGEKAVDAGKTIEAESDVRKPIYARRKVSQLLKIAEETAGMVSMPAELKRVVALAERDPTAAIDALLNERVLNEAEEFLSVLFVKRAAIVTKSVGRIVARGTRQGFGTGFLVAPGVLITNHHVLGSAADARNASVQFDYELNYRYRQGKTETFEFRPQDLFYADRSLDFALVAVAEKGMDHGFDLTNYGYLPLDEKVGKIRAEAPVNIIQHPQAGLKQVVFRDSKIFPLPSELDPGNSYSGKSVDTAAHYTGDTKPGSSGSPVFNDAWEVVALHHSAVAELDNAGRMRMKDNSFKATEDITDGDDVKWVANEGIRISRIMKHLRGLVKDGMFQGTELRLLQGVFAVGDKATQNGAFDRPLPRPIFAAEPETNLKEDVSTESAVRAVRASGPEQAEAPLPGYYGLHMTPGGVAITVPLTVQLSLGSSLGKMGGGNMVGGNMGGIAMGFPPAGGPDLSGTGPGFMPSAGSPGFAEERKYTAAELADRKGYDQDFLGITVPFPRLRDTAPGRLAQRLDGRGSKLDYDHYSVIMNAERRLAYVSAGNHDPLAPFKPARDKEPWSLDPRILENEQIGNELYKFNDLDRGHLLRRVDGSWGSSEKAALRADHDTYFWTNISPQHERLNQSKLQGIWGLLENSVTEQATATSTRYSVFNGPIFGDKDRTHRGIRIPSGFFKLVAFVDNGTLAALAFRLGQEELLVNLPLEKIEPNEFGVFQLPVSDLGDLVHLDFGPLVAADRFVKRQAGNESMVPGHRQKPIGGAGDIVV
jgi:DNA/RNA endonuclease G (NUC1)/V8-like Glu-specific endopeptidase/pimeloyl-ACP methyl ester carboxylesterase